MRAKTEHRKVTDAGYVYEELAPDERMMEDQRYEINAAIIEFAREIGKEVTPSNLGGYFTQFYALLRKSTGYFPSRKTLLTYHNPYVATKINTVLVDGKGADLLRVINTEIRSLHKRSTRPQLSLRLNS
ncbi:hypothetical protein [Paenibacillus polymyxa]|uniref:hypothetical protein n=1 Tax=Paenibacillus polymyxa TaxID=1406 RepID=UPI0012D3D20F|nr:hypothetical protein [Paenibacillus polymyxa]